MIALNKNTILPWPAYLLTSAYLGFFFDDLMILDDMHNAGKEKECLLASNH